MAYIERKNELKRRRKRRNKIKKLRAKMARAKHGAEIQSLVQKIKKISPLYPPDVLQQGTKK
jgi:hypothetical protein